MSWPCLLWFYSLSSVILLRPSSAANDARWLNGEWHWPPLNYKPSDGGSIENMIPDGSRPRKNITCKGSLPPWRLPVFPEWNPNESTLQEICAMPQFLGKKPGKHGPRSIPGYCGRSYMSSQNLLGPMAGSSLDRIRKMLRRKHYIVDSNLWAYPQVEWGLEPKQLRLYTPRLIEYCSIRCFCRQDFEFPIPSVLMERVTNTEQPFDNDTNSISLQPRKHTYPIRLERPPNFSDSLAILNTIKLPRYREKYINRDITLAARLIAIHNQGTEGYYGLDWSRNGLDETWSPKVFYLSLDRRNEISCSADEPMPTHWISLPPPAVWANFTSVQSLCAVALSGGHASANAGGFCRTYTDVPRGAARWWPFRHRQYYDVWFADELTPRQEWTWSSNFVFSGQVRRFCWQHCWCRNRPRPPKNRRPNDVSSWSVMDNMDMIRLAQDVLEIQKRDARGRVVAKVKLKGGPVGGGEYVEQKPWPTEVLGPVPTMDYLSASTAENDDDDDLFDEAMADFYREEEDDSSPQDTAVCASTSIACSGPGECARASTPKCPLTGQCVVDPASREGGWKEGVGGVLGPVVLRGGFAIATCLTVAEKGRLYGRDAEWKEKWLCACNGSYISDGCCGSKDGWVWED